jgi:hypothetical protein
MHSTVIGGAMLRHAPQFFTMPETEDKANVEKVRAVAHKIGTKLKAMKPDLWIIFSNDHVEQFFLNVAPPFTLHMGGEASGEFAGRKFRWRIPSEIGFELVRELYRQNFDPGGGAGEIRRRSGRLCGRLQAHRRTAQGAPRSRSRGHGRHWHAPAGAVSRPDADSKDAARVTIRRRSSG